MKMSKLERYRRRLAKQRAEAELTRCGSAGAAGPIRHIVQRVAKGKRRRVRPRTARRTDALSIIARAGRCGATAASLADTEAQGLALGVKLVTRGLVTVTRNNRFILKKHEQKMMAPVVNWDEAASFGMVEPAQRPRWVSKQSRQIATPFAATPERAQPVST
jgi:hypothetical protein